MPWCEVCSRFWNPSSMGAGGACPTCGRVLVQEPALPGTPWHFKLMLLALTIYLGYRAVQGVEWLVGHW
jgi:hypothetical protein